MRRRDPKTGRFVSTCDDPQKPESRVVDDVRVRFQATCDASGQPSDVRILSISSPALLEARRALRKGEISREEYEAFREALKEEVAKDLRRELSRSLAFKLEGSMRSDLGRKAASTRKRKQAALSEAERRKARDMAEALAQKIKALEAAPPKNPKEKTRWQARLKRLRKARDKLLRIAQGKAYKWPSPSEMR
ncbi:hypothetical protein [Thermus tengchongensis]|uniref:hypothetical protein n=1 Tax=Thermus tengchongensis TaxID=1214928 RepID=UPI001F3B67D6|nr:hypothetical protein [Thermus tengchongensis]